MGICQKKLHIGFSKFKRVVLLVLMTFCVCVQIYIVPGSQYCDTNSRLNKEKLTVGGSLKSSIVNSAIWH